MQSKTRILGLLACSSFLIFNAYGQGTTGHSPYSRFGLGDLFPQGGSRSWAMGETGIASPSDDNINVLNPALLPYNRVTNFQADAYWQRKKLSNNSDNQKATGGGLSNLMFSFPITRKVTMAMGLTPYSSTEYSVTSFKKIELDPDTSYGYYTYKGSGSLSKVFLSGGVQVTKGLSLGLQASYLMGTLTNESTVQVYPVQDNSIYAVNKSVRYSRVLLMPSFAYKAILDTTSKLFLCVGATAELGANDAKASTSTYVLQYSGAGNQFGEEDTLEYESKRPVSLPATYRFGVGLGVPRKWKLAADFALTDWSQLKTPNGGGNNLRKSYATGLGGEWTPNYNKAGYLNKITYRAGVRYQQTPIEISGQRINDMYVSLGASLPVFRKEAKFSYPLINVALQAGQRGTTGGSAIKENYFRVSLGFILNDNLWFSRYKID